MPKPSSPRKTTGAKSDHIRIDQYLVRYLHTHLDAISLSFQNLKKTPVASMMTIWAIGLCLALPMSLYLLIENIRPLNQTLEQGATLSIFIKAEVSNDHLKLILKKLDSVEGVKRSTYLSPEKALQEFQQHGEFKDALKLLPENPLPGVVSVQLDPKDPTRTLNLLTSAMTPFPEIISIDADTLWLEKLHFFLDIGQKLVHFLCLIIGIGVMLIIGNTLRLTLEKHKDEIDVLNLIGATKSYIRRPFLYRGMVYGALGGVIALTIVTLAVLFFKHGSSHSALFSDLLRLKSLSLIDAFLLLCASTLLGVFGALLAFSQQNAIEFHE